VCYSNIVPKTRGFLDIRLQKMLWSWNLGQRSLKVIESGSVVPSIRYGNSNSNSNNSNSRIVIGNHMYGFLLLLYSNFVCRTHRFWDIQLQKCYDLENRIKDPWMSLKMSPFDREPMISHWCSIVTMALSCVISEIFNVEKYCDLEIPVIHEPIKVIKSGTIR